MNYWKRRFLPSFLGSMLIFGGVLKMCTSSFSQFKLWIRRLCSRACRQGDSMDISVVWVFHTVFFSQKIVVNSTCDPWNPSNYATEIGKKLSFTHNLQAWQYDFYQKKRQRSAFLGMAYGKMAGRSSALDAFWLRGWIYPPPSSTNEGFWWFPTENIIILVVTIASWGGVDPRCRVSCWGSANIWWQWFWLLYLGSGI